MSRSHTRPVPPRPSSLQRAVARSLLLALLLAPPGAPPAWAGIAGEEVVAGEASFEQQGGITTIHASDGAIIQYDALDVWAHEELHFVQPHAQARVLNRVFGDATHIEGGLFANGIVYIVNPAGIFFGDTAVVDVGGLVAAAGTISNEDFLGGLDRFELSGEVTNAGRIEAVSVALLGAAVANHGSIRAPDGTIALVAGERVLLTRLGGHLHVEVEGGAQDLASPALEQTGHVDAGSGSVRFTTGDVYSLAINHEGITRGGDVELRAGSGLVEVAGQIDASARAAGTRGGSIAVTGELVSLRGAELDASGDAGGGQIRVGGDLRGAGALPTARRTHVDAASRLRSDALRVGDGGRVIVWADEATAFHGSVSARGGAEGGDGGFAEISGAVFLWSDGAVDLQAVQGRHGTLLYDPQDIQIVGGLGDGSDAPDALDNRLASDADSLGQILFADVGDLSQPFQINESELEGSDANILLEASHSITTTGTFDNDAAGEGVGVVRLRDGRSLVMRTRNAAGDEGTSAAIAGIDLGTVVWQTTGGASIALSTGDDGAGGGGGGVSADLRAGDLRTEGGSVSLLTRGSDIVVGDVDTSGLAGASGAAGGAVSFDAGGTGSVTAGAITSAGGAGSTGAGGAGGVVSITTLDGAIQVASIEASGGDGQTDGGVGGRVSLLAGDADSNGASAVDVVGAWRATGGDGTTGAGGAGGAAEVRSTGEPVNIGGGPGTAEPVQGGGALTLATLDTSGGSGATVGGAGGAVTGITTDGAITTGDIDSSGGDVAVAGGSTGGAAGRIQLASTDADLDNTNVITTGVLRAVGGAGLADTGGRGGAVDVQTQSSQRVVDADDPDVELQPAAGGGDVIVASVDTRGGDGVLDGGAGGNVLLVARGASVLSAGDAGTPAALTSGGSGNASGGAAGFAQIATEDGDLQAGAVDTRGGDADPADTALGGSGGFVLLLAGFGDDAAGDLSVLGNVDAREGASGALASEDALAGLDGGDVELEAAGGLEHGGQAGPHVRTTGDVDLIAGGALGAGGTFVVEGSGERRTDANGNPVDHDTLFVSAGGRADVQVSNAGFLRALAVTATDLAADIDVVQAGGDAVAMAGAGGQMLVSNADGTGNAIDVFVALQNPDEAAPDGTLVLATGSVTAGREFAATSHGDLVLGDGDGTVLTAAPVPDPNAGPGDPVTAGVISLSADSDGDGTGAVLDAPGADAGGLDLLGAADRAATLNLNAGEGVGNAADPINLINGGQVSATNRPRKPNPDPDSPIVNVPDDMATSGIYVRNTTSGDLGISDTRITAGSGEIVFTNLAGDVRVEGELDVTPRFELSGPGGDLTLSASGPGGRIVLDTPFAIKSGGRQTYDGDVVLARDARVEAEGGIELRGGLDTEAGAASDARFEAFLDATSLLMGDVGAGRALASFALRPLDGAMTTPSAVLDLDQVVTSGDQVFDVDVAVARDVSFQGGGDVDFGAALDERVAASSLVSVAAGGTASFGGDVGGTFALAGLSVSAGHIAFDATADQSVTTGAGGIALNPAGRASPPVDASVAKTGGDLNLSSAGTLLVGDGEKLAGTGLVALTGPTVRVSDVTALGISVVSPDAQVFARAPGIARSLGGGLVFDGGTDLIANTVAFSSAPTLVGAGPAPRIATLSGTAAGAGGIGVSQLERALVAGDISNGAIVFDLAIPVPDPGFETPELFGGAVEVPRDLLVSQDEPDSGPPPLAPQVLSFLACAPVGSGAPRAGCAPFAGVRSGSALDTERAVLLADAYRELLGEGAAERDGREALARAAADRRAPLGGADTAAAGRSYLSRLAQLMTGTRLLGLGPERAAEVRADLLAAAVAAIGSPDLDAERLGAAVEAYGEGLYL